ncbi:MAG: carboxypeptidase-like regulatory domain-containing protein [Chitinophagaceae bacterium]|nr:carboxypeptidase-like regulatory domain-containing protein [Chitinophagaceae bacterium]
MQKVPFCTAILLFLLPCVVFAGELKGRITDAKGEPLPFATVYVKGSTIGTAANASAEYRLPLTPGKYKINCQYIGFQQVVFDVEIKGDEVVAHNFSLKEQALEIKNVVIKANAEDPAYAIIRKAIKKRKFYQKQVSEFQSSIYMKTVVRNRDMPEQIFGIKLVGNDEVLAESQGGGADSNNLGIMYLSEQEIDYYNDGKRARTIIRSVRESGDPNGLGLPEVPPVVSFYDNNVNPLWGITERGCISPISENALLYYKYKYEGEFIQDGYTINKIKVTPRRLYEPLFQGTIYIVDKEWAIHSLDMILTKTANLTMIDTLRIEQTYLPLKKDVWIIKNQVQYPTVKLFGFDIAINFIAVYDNQKVNEPIPDSLFQDKITSSYEADATDKDSSYWQNKRLLPLEDDEKRDYKKKDSTYAKYTSPEYRDSMRVRGNKFSPSKLIMGGYSYRSKGIKHTFSTNSALGGMVSYNTVEGLSVSPQVRWAGMLDTGKYMKSVVRARYGFGNTHFNTYGRLSYLNTNRAWRTRKWEIGVEGGKYLFQYNPRNTITPLYNTFTTIAYAHNYMKLYERWTAAAFFEQNFGNGFKWSLKAGYQRRMPVSNTSFFTIVNDERTRWTNNVPATLDKVVWEEHDAALVKVELSYQPGIKYIQYPKFKSPQYSKWPVFRAQYEKGVPGIANSKSDFDRWLFAISDYMDMKLLGGIEYNASIGGFLNKNYVSLPDMMHVADNQLVLASPYLRSFQLAPYYMYSNVADMYGELHLEYNLNGFLTNKLPVFRRARWNVVTGANTLYMDNGNYYAEAYVGIDNLGYKIFRFLRVDVVRSWDSFNNTGWGVRIGIDQGMIGLVSGVSVNEDNEKFEW